MSTCSCAYVLLFLVLAVNFTGLHALSSRPFLCALGPVSYLSSIYVFGIQFFFLLQEKLFLTAANVQSTMAQFDSLPDPWVSPSH